MSTESESASAENTMAASIDGLAARRERYRRPAAAAAQRQHQRGKLLARERIERLCDPGSFQELWGLAHEPGVTTAQVLDPVAPADGVVTGIGTIRGIRVCVAADDATVFGGARGTVADRKLANLRTIALRNGLPFVSLFEGSAGRLPDLIGALSAGVGGAFVDQVALRGQVPTVSAIMGFCFGGPGFLAAMSDFVPMVEGTGFVGMSGPPVVKAGTGEEVTAAQVGGPDVQSRSTGFVDLVAVDEQACLDSIADYLEYVSRTYEAPGDDIDREVPELETLVPTRFREAYDMRKVLRILVDDGKFLEIKADFGKSIITGLARLGGRSVGVVASQPLVRAGTLDIAATRKIKAFIEHCDRTGIALLFIQDVPGFMIGPAMEQNGLIREASDLLMSLITARVPKVTLILRKSYGLSYQALGGKPMGADLVFAWPMAELGLMGPDAAARIMIKGNPTAEQIADLSAQYSAQMSAYIAAGNGLIDDVIAPRETRQVLIKALGISARGVGEERD